MISMVFVLITCSMQDRGERPGPFYHMNDISMYLGSLVPRPLSDFISQPWRKIGRMPGIIAMSWIGNSGHG